MASLMNHQQGDPEYDDEDGREFGRFEIDEDAGCEPGKDSETKNQDEEPFRF